MGHSRVRFVVQTTSYGDWEWILVNRGTVIARSARSWDNKYKALRAAKAVSSHASLANVVVDEAT